MKCAICQARRPKRFCPGMQGDICTICCGTEREVSVSCPLNCEYLQDARRHEKPVPLDPAQLPNRDIRVSESLPDENPELLAALIKVLADATHETSGVVDFDLRDAFEALIRTYRTLQSGLYYESLPDNAIAADVFGKVQSALHEFRAEQQRKRGIARIRDADVLGLLIFLQRLELDRNNGRRRGRAFVETVHALHAAQADYSEMDRSRLVVP